MQGNGEKTVVIEKPRVKDIAYIPRLEEGVVALTPQQEALLSQQVSNVSLENVTRKVNFKIITHN